MATSILLTALSVLSFLLYAASATTQFQMRNNCPFTIWPATLSGGGFPWLSTTGFQLVNGQWSQLIYVPNGWTGRFWARRQCSYDSSGRFSCTSGDCGTGQVACNNAGGRTPASLVEFKVNGDGNKDFYDVSLVDGYNLPVSVTPQGGYGDCKAIGCYVDINARCPDELRSWGTGGYLAGCKSACEAFNTDEYCCRGAHNTPQTCAPSKYANIFKTACPQAYSYAYDDSTSTFTCTQLENGQEMTNIGLCTYVMVSGGKVKQKRMTHCSFTFNLNLSRWLVEAG